MTKAILFFTIQESVRRYLALDQRDRVRDFDQHTSEITANYIIHVAHLEFPGARMTFESLLLFSGKDGGWRTWLDLVLGQTWECGFSSLTGRTTVCCVGMVTVAFLTRTCLKHTPTHSHIDSGKGEPAAISRRESNSALCPVGEANPV